MKHHISLLSVLASLALTGCCCNNIHHNPSETLGESGIRSNVHWYDKVTELPKPTQEEVESYEKIASVFFDFDQDAIKASEKAKITHISGILKDEPGLHIVINGYCDKKGSLEYNQALGMRRAESLKRSLASIGINPARIQTVSYGSSEAHETEDEHERLFDRRAEVLRVH